MTQKPLIAVAGAGLAGSLLSLALLKQGWRVALIDPKPSFSPGLVRNDGRSTAVMSQGLKLLEKLGLYDDLMPVSQPLWYLRLIDGEAALTRRPDIITFDASEVGQGPFAQNVPNAAMLAETYRAIEADPNFTAYSGRKITGIDQDESQVYLSLSDGSQIEAAVLLAADGRGSFVREHLGLRSQKRDTDQATFTFAVDHSLTHKNISTEFHYACGPLTFVPMPGNRSAVVWSSTSEDAQALNEGPREALVAELQRCSHGILGALSLALDPHLIHQAPILAQDLVQGRVALLAEAAHALPPIGAQGLNLTMGDIGCLLNLLEQASDPGAPDLLKSYARIRKPDMMARYIGTNTLDRITGSKSWLAKSLQSFGMQALNASASLRKAAMVAGSSPVKLL